MIFVSYCREDKQWRERFEIMSKPLSRIMPIEFWSDEQLKAGEWDKQVKIAMDKAEAVVFLVSAEFLASRYIVETELKYFLGG